MRSLVVGSDHVRGIIISFHVQTFLRVPVDAIDGHSLSQQTSDQVHAAASRCMSMRAEDPSCKAHHQLEVPICLSLHTFARTTLPSEFRPRYRSWSECYMGTVSPLLLTLWPDMHRKIDRSPPAGSRVHMTRASNMVRRHTIGHPSRPLRHNQPSTGPVLGLC